MPFPKVRVIARVEFELAYYDVIVQHVRHYGSVTPLRILCIKYCYLKL